MAKKAEWNEEHLRILKAADRGALTQNESTRWVIADEVTRPARKEREHLLYGRGGWPCAINWSGRITADGKALLAELPGMIARSASSEETDA